MEAVMATTRDNLSMASDRSNRAAAEATLEFGRFRVLLRQRQLAADGVPIELGTRALDLLMVLLEADGSLVSKDELLSRVWPGIVVAEENLKVQISALRKALGEDRDFIRTEFGRGYRFTATIRSAVSWGACERPTRRWHRSKQRSVPQWILGNRRTVGMSQGLGGSTAPQPGARARRCRSRRPGYVAVNDRLAASTPDLWVIGESAAAHSSPIVVRRFPHHPGQSGRRQSYHA
jgi:DNA-binding winged helix-turn-helix (wHTH) protein